MAPGLQVACLLFFLKNSNLKLHKVSTKKYPHKVNNLFYPYTIFSNGISYFLRNCQYLVDRELA
jgi:hypothetical protein